MAARTKSVMVDAVGAPKVDAPLERMKIERRPVGPEDVDIEIKYAGICHSDISQAKGEWGGMIFPMVPGHEIVGVVTAVGTKVTKVKVGDKVGVGCMVDSCLDCQRCSSGDEQYCASGAVFTYNGVYKYDRNDGDLNKPTYGGYSKSIVVREKFVLHVPENLDLAASAPLLCAGITMYSPLIHYGVRPHHKVGIAGLGGLGHMGVKLAKAFGAHVTVISRGDAKREPSMQLGADAYVDIKDSAAAAAAAGSLDYIIDTIGVQHNAQDYVNMLKIDGTMIMVGIFPKAEVAPGALIMQRRRLAGSLIGGIRETQEMLDFCGRHNIVSDIELIKADEINTAYERALQSDVKYRFVIDIANTL